MTRYQPQTKTSRPAAKKPSGCWRILGCLGNLTLFGFVFALASLLMAYGYLSYELGDAIDRVVAYQGMGPGGTPRFYDRHGTLLFEMPVVEKRKALTFKELPDVIIQATIAVEDDTFWDNWGVDPTAIGAAVLYNYQNQDARPVGASTITQQLVRHIAFAYEERVGTSYERKIREIFLAFIITTQRSKEDILTMYLNEIYYGNLAYGIEAAAQTYLGKSATELNLAEAAFLAGLPQAPIQWDPYTNFEGAKTRQAFILDLMAADGRITPAEAETAKTTPIYLATPISVAEQAQNTTLLAPHFVLYIQNQLAQKYGGKALIRGGWQITTSLDLNIQNTAEQILRDQIALKSEAHRVSNGAVVVMKPSSSEILAMVGSANYFDEAIDGQINMALSPRQPGSTFKPITYLAALEKGWTTGDVLWDVPIELELTATDNMTPVNYDGRYHGPLLFRDALANSYNIPPLQLARDVGVPFLIQTARKLGVVSLSQDPSFYGLSLTLGGGEVPLLEMTHAFSTISNQGKFVPLAGVLKITDSQGKVVFDLNQLAPLSNQIVDPAYAFIVADILDDDRARVPAMGAGTALELPFPAAVKTGTTNDFRDNLTIGFTPNLVVGVWMGNTDGTLMVNSSGLQTAAPVWSNVVQAIYGRPELQPALLVNGQTPPIEFIPPPNVEQKTVCLPRGTGGSTCGASRNDWFKVNTYGRALSRIGYIPDLQSTPGAWVVNVLPMTTEQAQQINLPPLDNGFAAPLPTYCVVGGLRNLQNLQTKLMLAIPPFYPDEVRARLWAKQNGYQMAPPVACPTAVVRANTASNNNTGGNTNTNNNSSNENSSP